MYVKKDKCIPYSLISIQFIPESHMLRIKDLEIKLDEAVLIAAKVWSKS